MEPPFRTRCRLALFFLLAGCQGGREQPPVAVAPVDCAELHRDGRCDLGVKQDVLRVWLTRDAGTLRGVMVEHASGTPSAAVAPRRLRSDGTGTIFAVSVPPGATALRLETEHGVGRLALARAEETVSDRVRALRNGGKVDEARALARAALTGASDAERARGHGALARVQLSAGEIEVAVASFRAAIAADERAGLLTSAARDRIALADTLRRRSNDLAGARAALSGISPRVRDRAAWGTFQLGALEAAAGNPRAALGELTRARESARAYGLDELVVAAAEIIACVLSSLGQHEEALATIDQVTSLVSRAPCDRAGHLANVGWVRFAAATEGVVEYDEGPSLEAARLFETECVDPWNRDNALLDAALSRAARGQYESALALLERAAQGAAPGFEVEAFRGELTAQLALAAGRPAEALADYEQLSARLGSAAPFTALYRSELGRARALRALGRRDEAVVAYRAAEASLTQEEREVPLDDGRGSFVGVHHAASDELVALLVELGRPDEAFTAARRARRRLLASFERRERLAHMAASNRARFEQALERFGALRTRADAHAAESWAVPSDERSDHDRTGQELARELSRALDEAFAQIGGAADQPLTAPPPDEAWLTVSPTPNGWLALLAFGGRVRTAELPTLELPDDALAQALLEPFARELSQARALRVLAGGAFEAVAVHTLPFRAAPLLAQLPVVYALDLPPVPERATPAGPVLVVSNPRGDLPYAVREAELVVSRLAPGQQPESLAGPAATVQALLSALPHARWFHFAGHAEVSKQGMLRSALSLADDTRLELSTVLTLGAVPDVVVLSACEGARPFRGPRRKGAFAGLGLAQSFLLAGSRAVLATTAKVADEVAYAMTDVLYAAPFSGRLDRETFRRAALALRARAPDGFPLFRLLER